MKRSLLQDDPNPGERFIWVKKQKVDEMRGLTPAEIERLEGERRERNKRELEKLESQRLKWEAEREQKRQDKDRVGNERATEELGDWQEKERIFHLGQALAKAQVRVKGGRADPFDLVIINTVSLSRGSDDIDVVFTDDLIELLGEADGDELVRQLEEFMELERDELALNYLNAILSYLHEDRGEGGESHQLQVVKEDVFGLLQGKSAEDLTKLGRSIETKLAGPGPVDTEYWSGLLVHLHRFRRRALVRETHALLVDRRMGQLGEGFCPTTLADWRLGGETPVIAKGDVPAATPSPVHDGANWDPSPESLRLLETEAHRKISQDELPFNEEYDDHTIDPPDINLVKPRYFNRVRTAFEWNKYNQTHYDAENPPPRTVQGYRFNIFYPLISNADVAPSYKLEPDLNDPNCKILRFKAGPPYQDVTFRIAGEAWDQSHRQGFKCCFEGGVLRLHFCFKSQRYKS